jgi:hypothetical protein
MSDLWLYVTVFAAGGGIAVCGYVAICFAIAYGYL